MRAYLSPLKTFIFGVAGIILIAAAVDVVFGYWLSVEPDAIDGVLTTRGLAQQRGDILWGGTMVVAGVLLFGGAVTELVRRKPIVAVEGDGLRLFGSSEYDLIPWEDIDDVSSGTIRDPYDGAIREQLIVSLTVGAGVQTDNDGDLPEPDTVYIDAHDWSSQVTDIALAAQGAHDHFMRMEAVKSYEPPSIVWETKVSQPETDDSSAVASIELGEPDIGDVSDEDGEVDE